MNQGTSLRLDSRWFRRLPAHSPIHLLASCFSQNRNGIFLATCLAIIVTVSVYDSWLVYLMRDQILEDEKNPICLALIQLDPQNLSWFYGGKFLGNVFVAGTLTTLFMVRYKYWCPVTISVTGFQLMLTLYLKFSDPTTGVLHFEGLFSYHDSEFNRSLGWLLIEAGLLMFTGTTIAFGWYRLGSTFNPRRGDALDERALG